MLAEASKEKGPARMAFPASKSIRVATGTERYVFRIDGAANLTIDGAGSTFLLAPDVRFMKLTNSRKIAIRRLNIDFSPLPFADGTVTAVDAGQRHLDITPLSGTHPLPTGGPAGEDGEQAFFGMLWYDGPYGTISRHCRVKSMEPGPQPGTVRLTADESFKQFKDIVPGKWRISLPVPGIAHRCGPGACLDIFDNENLIFEDVELWSAPWFGFRVFRNSGEVTFRRVHIRPRPDTGRLTSTWRDGFHVKGNRAKLLWEDCVLSAMNDDAFNISTHCSRVREINSQTEIAVRQAYPLNYMPWHAGATVAAADFENRTLLGSARILKVTESAETKKIGNSPGAPQVTLVLDRPIPGLKRRAMVWEPQSANPDTTLRRCRIEKSCRLQSPVKLEKCDVTAFLWFYAARPEGPFPSGSIVRGCVLRRGRGNQRNAVSFMGRAKGASGRSALHGIVFERNKVRGGFSMVGVDDARLSGNEFLEEGAPVMIEDCRNLLRGKRPSP
jgi:hypothetical protein